MNVFLGISALRCHDVRENFRQAFFLAWVRAMELGLSRRRCEMTIGTSWNL